MSEADDALTIARRALESIANGQAARIEHLVAKNALDEMFRVKAQRVRAAIAERNRLRGRELTAREQLMNLTAALGEHDSDCSGKPCSCGADDFNLGER